MKNRFELLKSQIFVVVVAAAAVVGDAAVVVDDVAVVFGAGMTDLPKTLK